MVHGSSNPSSPISTKGRSSIVYPDAVPLDSNQRTESLHQSLPNVKLPASTSDQNSTLLNPITLRPFTAEELKTYNFNALRKQYKSPEEARSAQNAAILELKERMDEHDRKTKEVEREMEEKEKTREIERKIYKKKLGQEVV